MSYEERLRLAAARLDFLESGELGAAGVPDLVAASWRRSRSAGIAADAYNVPYFDDIDIDTDSRLARCAQPVLERLTLDMSDVPVSIALTDSRARIIDRRDCSTAVGRVLDRVDFNPGFSFDEHGVGTNGIGTVFEAGAPVSVVGAAHFSEALVPFACTGAPVLDPLTGRVEGVLDVSLLSESWSPLIHALVKGAAADIGRNLLLDRGQAQQALFETYLRADTRTRHAVVAVGETVMVNRRAQALLSPDELVVVQQHALAMAGRRTVSGDDLTLESGRRLHLRVVRVLAGEDVSGVVLLVSEAESDERASAPRPTAAPALPDPVGPLVASRCPAWRRAAAEAHAALDAGQRLLVVGEPGSGRARLVTDLFGQLWPSARPRLLDAREVSDSTLTEPDETPSLLVLRDLDRLDAAGSARVCALVDRLTASAGHAGRRWTVAATMSAPSSRTVADSDTQAAAAALTCFDASVTVPALRFRTIDLSDLAAAMLADLAPGRRVRLSPAAVRSLCAFAWPENLTQLRRALTAALARRPVGEIQDDDLPPAVRSGSTRTLSAIETVERDAIVAALTACGGNRVRAAEQVGMSRSSLYRKLHTYGISEV